MLLSYLYFVFICFRSLVFLIIRIIQVFDDGVYNGVDEDIYGDGMSFNDFCGYICLYKYVILGFSEIKVFIFIYFFEIVDEFYVIQVVKNVLILFKFVN